MTEPIWHNADDIRIIEELEAEVGRLKEKVKEHNTGSYLSYIHMLCTDMGIEQGHIDYRSHQLFNKVHDMMLKLSRYEAATVVEGIMAVNGVAFWGTGKMTDYPLGARVRVLIMPEGN